jgi:hypothetical protein
MAKTKTGVISGPRGGLSCCIPRPLSEPINTQVPSIYIHTCTHMQRRTGVRPTVLARRSSAALNLPLPWLLLLPFGFCLSRPVLVE